MRDRGGARQPAQHASMKTLDAIDSHLRNLALVAPSNWAGNDAA